MRNVIRGIVPWTRSRHYFYWRLRRLLVEEDLKQELESMDPKMNHDSLSAIIEQWFIEDQGHVKVGCGVLSTC